MPGRAARRAGRYRDDSALHGARARRLHRGPHFELKGTATVEDLANAAAVPLSVILQVTKRCNFDCTFCPETLQLPDPTLADLERIRDNLAGVQRVTTPITTGSRALPSTVGTFHVLYKSPVQMLRSPYPRGSPLWYPDMAVHDYVAYRQ